MPAAGSGRRRRGSNDDAGRGRGRGSRNYRRYHRGRNRRGDSGGRQHRGLGRDGSRTDGGRYPDRLSSGQAGKPREAGRGSQLGGDQRDHSRQ